MSFFTKKSKSLNVESLKFQTKKPVNISNIQKKGKELKYLFNVGNEEAGFSKVVLEEGKKAKINMFAPFSARKTKSPLNDLLPGLIRTGRGKSALNLVLQDLKKMGIKQVTLTPKTSERVIGFYVKQGFKFERNEKGKLIMKKDL